MNLFSLEKNGICTKHGATKYRAKFMQDGNNHLFGKIYGNEIGVSYNRFFSNRNTNVLVVGEAGMGKTHNYVETNLLQENHSAVVVDEYGVLYAKYGDYLRKKGYNVYCINFNYPEISCRFNPFLHNAYECRERTIEKFTNDFATACKGNVKALPPYEQAVCYALLKVMFYYVFYSPILSEEQRSFEYVQAVAEKFQIYGREILDKYDCNDNFEKEFNLLKTVSDEVFRKAIVSALADLNAFVATRSDNSKETVFDERENTTNFSIEEFTSQQSYLFITASGESDVRVSFLIAQIIAMLFAYSNKFWKKADTEYPYHIQFYLDNFSKLNIGDLLTSIAVCKKHGFNFSILVRTMEELIAKYEKDEDWLCIKGCSDAQVFMGNNNIHKEMVKMINNIPRLDKKTTNEPVLDDEEIKKIFSENKQIVIVRDCYPIICEKLNPADYENKSEREM